jgi:hypothetical protein
MGGLSFSQWLRLIAAAPSIVAEVKLILPVVVPVVKHILALVHELGLDKPSDAPLTPREVAEKIGLGDLTPEEQATLDRMLGK